MHTLEVFLRRGAVDKLLELEEAIIENTKLDHIV